MLMGRDDFEFFGIITKLVIWIYYFNMVFVFKWLKYFFICWENVEDFYEFGNCEGSKVLTV